MPEYRPDYTGGGWKQVSRLPRYRCHKEVSAFKIKQVVREKPPAFERPTCKGSFVFGSACGHCEHCEWERGHPGQRWFLVPEDPGIATVAVDSRWIAKHDPQPGGYYVRYADAYASYSPAEAFESGYTLIPETT